MVRKYEDIDPKLPQAVWEARFKRMHNIHSLAIRLEDIATKQRDLESTHTKIFDQKAADLIKQLD